ncbi:MAG: oligosaccharide flippase family protein [Lachnospiraceae bacterium]|nr:oligosaccharide flippase family protein [Lachnospiraceae bacterium]
MLESNGQKNKALFIGTMTYAIGNFGTKILSFLIVPLYTYYIKPSDLGDYDLLITTVSLLSPLLTMKISDATYRWLIKNPDNCTDYISATYQVLVRNCLIAAVFLLLVNQIIPIWNCYYFVAILVGDRILECVQKLLRGLKNQKLFAVSGILYTAILVFSNFIKICLLKQGVVALLQSVIFSQWCTIIFLFIVEKRLRAINWKKKYGHLQKEMLHYSVPLVPATLSWWVMSASDRYVIRWLLGSAANGIYAIAGKFPSILQMIFTMFNNAWTDMALAELGKDVQNEAYTEKIFKQLYKLSFCMVLILIPVTKIVTRFILSDAYKTASIYIGFLYLGTVFQGFSSFCSIGYLQQKTTGGAAKTSMYGALANLVIDVVVMRFMGLHAASVSTFAGFFMMWLCRMQDIKESFPVRINKNIFSLYFILSIGFATVTIWTNVLADMILTVIAVSLFWIANGESLKQIIMFVKEKKSGKK